MEELKNVLIPENSFLVQEIKDYYRGDSSKFVIQENETQAVGHICKVGITAMHKFDFLQEDPIGKVVFFHGGGYTKINLKGLGSFLLIDATLVHAIVTDQTKDNY